RRFQQHGRDADPELPSGRQRQPAEDRRRCRVDVPPRFRRGRLGRRAEDGSPDRLDDGDRRLRYAPLRDPVRRDGKEVGALRGVGRRGQRRPRTADQAQYAYDDHEVARKIESCSLSRWTRRRAWLRAQWRATAANAFLGSRIATWVDAWRGDVYSELYVDGRSTGDPVVAKPDDLLSEFRRIADPGSPIPSNDILFIGDGAETYRDLIAAK